MKYLWISLIGFASLTANAEAATPFLDSEVAIGRMKLRESLSGDLVYVPALFAQRFFCDEISNVCTLQVFNRMTEGEEAEMRRLREKGRSTWGLRAQGFPDGLVVETEKLQGEIAQIPGSFLTSKNFALGENPYGSAVFKAPKGESSSLTAKYDSAGLGKMEIRYRLKGVVRDFSIRVSTEFLEGLLLNSVGESSLSFEELKTAVKANLSHFSVIGYSPEDAVVIVAHHLKEAFLKTNRRKLLKLDSDKFARFKERMKAPFWVIGETVQGAEQSCVLTLPIKKGAEMIESCEVEYENE